MIETRTGPATITRMEQGRRYKVLGQPMKYLGQGVTGQHWFAREGERGGLEEHSDPYVQELLATARIIPLGPAPEPTT